MAGTHVHFICFLYIFMLDFLFTFLEKCPLLLKKSYCLAH